MPLLRGDGMRPLRLTGPIGKYLNRFIGTEAVAVPRPQQPSDGLFGSPGQVLASGVNSRSKVPDAAGAWLPLPAGPKSWKRWRRRPPVPGAIIPAP